MSGPFDAAPASTALLVVDLQNDFLHPDGAYARGGATAPALTAVVEPAAAMCRAARSAGVPVVTTHFTLVGGRAGSPLISSHLRALRPFLRAGDFASGSWGHAALDAIGEADATVEKVAYSAFAHTRLGWWLDQVGVDRLVVCGIVTSGGVASTVHDAHVRGYGVSIVADACAAFDPDLHDATIRSLSSVGAIVSSAEVVAAWAPGPA